jgi:hypothetical protein
VVLDDWMGREHLVEPLPVEAAVEAAVPAAVEEGLQNGAAEAKDEAVGIEAIAPPAGERAVTVPVADSPCLQNVWQHSHVTC